MKKIQLVSQFILYLLSSPLFTEEMLPSTDEISLYESNRGSKKKTFPVCCQRDYRLPVDFKGVNTFAEALIWQVQQETSYFVATPNEHSTLDPLSSATQLLGDIQSASFDWNSGIRVGLGYTFIEDAWQLLGQYTWYSTSGKNSFSAPNSTTEVLMSVFSKLGLQSPTAASSSVHFSYQMGDLLLARRFLLNDILQCTPFIGVTGGNIKEHFHVLYDDPLKTYVINTWKFTGGGFRIGMDANWHISHGFGLFGRCSFAAILGQYANHNRTTADAPSIFTSQFNGLGQAHLRDTTSKTIFLIPTNQLIFGFDWTRTFVGSKISGIRIAIAGEFNYLSNLQQIPRSTEGPTLPTEFGKSSIRDMGGVYMYGGNLRLGIDF